MLKILFGFFVVLFFLNGCSSQKDDLLLNNFKNNQEKFEQIQKTSKVTITQDGQVVGFITGLYQPSDKYEKFLVGVYAQEELQNIHFMLDAKDALRVEELQNNDIKLNQIPLKNKWSRYFEVTFIKSDSNIMNLQVYNGKIWNKTIRFSKVPNYLNSKEVF